MKKNTIISNERLEQSIATCLRVIDSSLAEFANKFKVDGSVNNFYEPKENISWTTGFWTGQVWMAYELTDDEKYKEVAQQHIESFLYRIENRIDINHHDMGFLYSLSAVAGYKLTGSIKGKKAALLAADHLITRYQEKGEFIQAWGNPDGDDNYRLIIDCLLNQPLLFWASEVTGDKTYENKAIKHIDTSLKVIMREDYSTYHTYYFDKLTGDALYGETRQGYSDDSAWARGQAWGIYGTALSYKYTKNPKHIEKFYLMTDYFIKYLPKDGVPYWDLCFQEGSEEPRDSSAGAIAVCGMLEMAKYLSKDKANYYTEIALKIMDSLISNYQVINPETSNGLLLHGVYAKKSPYNPCEDHAVDECTIWGDYFFLEGLIRLKKEWQLYW